MARLVLLFLITVFFIVPCRSETQMTPQQREMADGVVGARIAAVQHEIVSQPPWAILQSSIAELAKRQKKWESDGPAAVVGHVVQECRDRHVPVPASINEKVIDDIIWQFRNPYGDEPLTRQRHQATCARALAQIGHPKGVPFIIQSLAQPGEEHFLWDGLVGIADERLIPTIEKYLDFSNQQDAFPAIESLARMGEKAIPVLERFLKGDDRNLREKAVDALIDIGTPSCIPVLKKYLTTADTRLTWRIQMGLLRIQCRAIDKIYTPPSLLPEDEARVWHLAELALLGEKTNERSMAADTLVAIGAVTAGILRTRLEDSTHNDYFDRPEEFYVSQRAADILKRIGAPAIPTLIDALCSVYQVARIHAAETLRQQTGQKFGSDYNEWRQWFLDQQNRQTPA